MVWDVELDNIEGLKIECCNKDVGNFVDLYSFNSGPAAHPLFGNFMTMTELDPVPYRAFDFLTQNFGPIIRLVFGPSILVNIGGYKEIKEAMNNELLDDRESSPTADLIRKPSNFAF